MSEIPVFLQRLALVGEDGRTVDGDRSGRVILRREDVARGPTNLRTERLQRLNEHGRLDGHVQRAGDAGAAQRLRRGELLADRHQARHFGLGDTDFLATPIGEGEIGDVEVGLTDRFNDSVHGLTPLILVED